MNCIPNIDLCTTLRPDLLQTYQYLTVICTDDLNFSCGSRMIHSYQLLFRGHFWTVEWEKKPRCFASSVKMLQHHILVNELLEAILHWSKLVNRKWSAHIWNYPVSQENAMAGFIPQQATVSSSSMVHGLLIQVQLIIRSVFEKFRKACAVDSSFVSPLHTLFYMRWHVSYMDQWISKRGDKLSFWLSMVCTNASHMSYTWWKLFDTQTDVKKM